MKIKLEHIDNLRRGKKSGAKIGSRGVPHHLFQYEEVKYDRALKNRFLEITSKERVNLENLWEKVCIAKKWENYILKVLSETQEAAILKNGTIIEQGDKKLMKSHIKNYV